MVLDRMDKVVPMESTEEVKEAVVQELMDPSNCTNPNKIVIWVTTQQ